MEGIRLADEIYGALYFWRFENYRIKFDLDTLIVEGTKGEEDLDDEELIQVIVDYNLGLSLDGEYDVRLIDVLTVEE